MLRKYLGLRAGWEAIWAHEFSISLENPHMRDVNQVDRLIDENYFKTTIEAWR